MARAKKETWPKHQMGQHCGYDLFEDGSIRVAPKYTDELRVIREQELAMEALLATVTRQCHELLTPILRRREQIWRDMAEDYGVQIEGRALSTLTGILKPAKSDE